MILRFDPLLPIGKMLPWTVTKPAKSGWYLNQGEYEVFMTEKEAGEDFKEGQTLEAFVFRDSEGRLTALRTPAKLLMGEIGLLTVNHVTDLGAFLEWGISKELLLAKSEWKRPLEPGEEVLVRVLLDEQNRPAATLKIWESLEKPPEWEKGRSTLFCVLSRGFYGLGVSLDTTYRGFLSLQDSNLAVGHKGEGFFLGTDENDRGRISLRPPGKTGLYETADKLLSLLEQNSGFLPVHDHSTPELIFLRTGMSKKDFKKVCGLLFKAKKIEILDRGIKTVTAED